MENMKYTLKNRFLFEISNSTIDVIAENGVRLLQVANEVTAGTVSFPLPSRWHNEK